uniref:Uncharacterized protein n=2 Tax=Musa acuminata subsp. malaccensis TaxID=214687 RepID=A0A804L775_MUSAM
MIQMQKMKRRLLMISSRGNRESFRRFSQTS